MRKMPLFGSSKKGDKPAEPVQASLPIDKVLDMRNKGLSNNQIIEALQKDNYSTTQIFDALNQAELKGELGLRGMEPMEGNPDKPIDFNVAKVSPIAEPAASKGMTEEELVERIEEVTEKIIEEKWKDFVETVEKIIEWKNAFTERVDGLEKELKFLKDEFDKLHTAILRKVDQYDKSMGNVGAQLKAMEMVFKDVLPKFTENVNQLSSFTRTISKRKTTSKKKTR